MVDDVVAETRSGKIRGIRQNGVYAFKGIPYGASTGGINRFRPPQKREPWSGVRDAIDYGYRAPQCESSFALARPIHDLVTPTSAQSMSEDCLFLNLWTPNVRDAELRPVLVWLHGGAFTNGSGADPWTHGTNLAYAHDVVVITLNHRLGALGYLHLEGIAESDFAGSSLAGMFDIIAALRWIRDNIAEFGGDASNVTLFGQSGGGAKICTLMAMPTARGLFHKAIVQSGPALRMADRHDATITATAFLEELELRPERACELRDVPLERILAAQEIVTARAGMARFADRRRVGFNPPSGSADFPSGPFDQTAPALSADIPLLIGVTEHEMTIFFALESWLAELDDRGLRHRLAPFVDGQIDALVDGYRSLYSTVSAGDLFMTIIGHQGIALPSFAIADLKAAQNGAPVFAYLFRREAPVLNGCLRSGHVIEVPYVFRTVGDAPFLSDSSEDRQLGDKVSAAWAQFARTGRPGAAGMPKWPPYRGDERATMSLDLKCQVEADPFRSAREVWSHAGGL